MKLTMRFLGAATLLALAACATVKAPTLEVQRLGRTHVGVTGAQLEVVFAVRNPNPYDMLVERFDYELRLNGRRLGRGFVTEPLPLRAFDRTRVVSRFDLGFLRLPGAVKRMLEDDRVQARARGHFYVREGGRTRKLGFDSEAQVDLR